jgi:hypothetical protein
MKNLMFGLRALVALPVPFLMWFFSTHTDDIAKMAYTFVVTMILLVFYLIAEIFYSLWEDGQKDKQAFALGYQTMKNRLNEPYCGEDPGYDHLKASKAYVANMALFSGAAREQGAYLRGTLEALTEYEQEYGAP